MQRIREEMVTFLESPEKISESLFKMKKSAKTEEDIETVNWLWIQHMKDVISDERLRKPSDSSDTDAGSNDVLAQEEKRTTPVTDHQDSTVQFPIYDNEGRACGTYEFLRTGDGKAKCSEEACRNQGGLLGDEDPRKRGPRLRSGASAPDWIAS